MAYIMVFEVRRAVQENKKAGDALGPVIGQRHGYYTVLPPVKRTNRLWENIGQSETKDNRPPRAEEIQSSE